jgi:hypothetical protein
MPIIRLAHQNREDSLVTQAKWPVQTPSVGSCFLTPGSNSRGRPGRCRTPQERQAKIGEIPSSEELSARKENPAPWTDANLVPEPCQILRWFELTE